MWAAALAATSPPPVKQTTWRHLQQRGYNYTFAEYTQEFGKAYNPAEYAKRQQAFADALAVIRAHNEDPSSAWKMGLSDHTALFDQPAAAADGHGTGLSAGGRHGDARAAIAAGVRARTAAAPASARLAQARHGDARQEPGGLWLMLGVLSG